LLAVGILTPMLGGIVFILHERMSLALIMLGMWWLAGLVVIHWWIPAARQSTAHTEGIAAAGWHSALTMAATGFVAWLLIFQAGPYSPFTLRETRPIIVSWIVLTMIFGGLVIWFRGHTPARSARYSVFALSMGTAWMALGLVAAHSYF
jgi:hypothetical protein